MVVNAGGESSSAAVNIESIWGELVGISDYSAICWCDAPKKSPRYRREGFASITVGLVDDYLELKSSIHQPSSHSKATFLHPNGTWGYG